MKPKPAKIADVAHRRQSAFCVKFVIYRPLRPDYRITRLWVKLYWVVNWQSALARHGKAMLIAMVL